MVLRTRSRTCPTIVVSSLVAAAVVIAAASPAQAMSKIESSDQMSSAAVTTEAVPETNMVVTDAGVYAAGITLPGEVSSSAVVDPDTLPDGLFVGSDEPVLTTTLEDAVISSYSTDKGTQTLIRVDSAAAAHEYRFPLSLPAGAHATVEPDGSVAVRLPEGDLVGGYQTPWAYDALGRTVATSFSLDGDTLIQTVAFDEATAFPVIADPSDAWGWTQCLAVVAGEIAINANLAGKIAKLASRFGTIQKAMEVIYRAWKTSSNADKKRQAIIDAVGDLAAEVTGVAAIKAACIDS